MEYVIVNMGMIRIRWESASNVHQKCSITDKQMNANVPTTTKEMEIHVKDVVIHMREIIVSYLINHIKYDLLYLSKMRAYSPEHLKVDNEHYFHSPPKSERTPYIKSNYELSED